MLVVTTPNREYNPVLQHLGNSLIPPNNTRNSNHRFEWYSPLPPLRHCPTEVLISAFLLTQTRKFAGLQQQLCRCTV